MLTIKEYSYKKRSDIFIDFVIGIIIFALSILTLLFPQIGDALFKFLMEAAMRSRISDGSDALGVAILVSLIVFGFPVAVGILTFLMTRLIYKRKNIFRGYLSGLIVSVIVRIAIAFF